MYVGPDGPAREVDRLKNIGRKAHGLVAWGNSGLLILLDSDNGMLVSMDPSTGDEVELWQVLLGNWQCCKAVTVCSVVSICRQCLMRQ